MHISCDQGGPAARRPPQIQFPKVGGFLGLVVAFVLPGCAPQPAPYPQPGMAIWQSHDGGTIEGSATLRSGPSGYARTCAGFDAYIIPATPQTTAFIQEHFNRLRDGYAPRVSLRDALGPFVTNNGGGRVSCHDDGTFTFADLANGRYFVLADITWSLRWAQEGGTVSSVADVSGPQSTHVVIDVSLNMPGGVSHVSR